MKPLKLIGLGNVEKDKRSYFIFEKSNNFLIFNEILEKIGIDKLFYDELGAIESKSNELDHINNDRFDIDVVYTQDRIILIVRGKQKDLERFKSLILDYSIMQE
jgi:hypothetical protein